MNANLITQFIAAELTKRQFELDIRGNIGRGWSFTKKGPGRRHNSTGINRRLRQIKPFELECNERHRIGVYSNEFWKRWDKFAKSKGDISLWEDLANSLRNILRRR